MNSNQQSYRRLLQIAVNGFQEFQNKNDEELKQWLSKQPLFPSTVPVGRDGFAFITAEGYSALKQLGRAWHGNDTTRSRMLSRPAAEELAVSAFGELLGDPSKIAANVDAKSELLRIMETHLRARTETLYFYFPAQVFDQPDVGTFAIGPVTFYRPMIGLRQWKCMRALHAHGRRMY